jgi:pyruvate/2-oxoglutarate dehydrogenase complex dihydrolipoamide acyltransferase (E2) component
MVTQILLPKIGWMGMPKCRNKIWLGKWYKSNGAEIEADEVIAEIETPKARIEIKAPASGVLFWMKKNNVKVHLLDVLGVVFDKL